MSISEFIGLIIMLLVLGLSVLRRAYDATQPPARQASAEEAEAEKEDLLRKLLGTLDLEDEMPPKRTPSRRPPPPPVVGQQGPKRLDSGVRERVVRDFDFHGNLEDRHPHSAIESRHIETHIDEHTGEDLVSRRIMMTGDSDAYRRKGRRSQKGMARTLVQSSHLRDAILLNEIISPPLSLREQ